VTARKRNWIIGIALFVLVAAAGLAVAASIAASRIEPYARQAAIRYLSQRFASDVELRALRVRLPKASLLRLILTQGRGISARIEGEGLSMRLKSQPTAPPLFAIRTFHCEVGVDSLLHPPAYVSEVFVEGMEIQIPPRGERPQLASSSGAAPEDTTGAPPAPSSPGVMIAKVIIRNAALTLRPKDPRKLPLRFEIPNLQLQSVSRDAPMKYEVALRNAKPPGDIHATGTFGPWRSGDPGETPVAGDYLFEKADLGVFAGIAGTLNSTGRFEGQLSALTVHGQASVPNFRLRISGNPVPLTARFSALVDGTNGNTILQPVTATLGSTSFTTSGGIVKHEADQHRTILLNVTMPNGNMRDVLRLAMKGDPFMEGKLALKTKIDIPPLAGKVREKLVLDGRFEIHEGKFLHSTIQNQIDNLSQRAQGQPGEPATEQAVSHMSGVFHMENAAIRFNKLTFGLPGADLDLTGDYSLDSDALDFGGTLKLQATISQMVSGWKGKLLKPVDRFFEKDGAGTFLHIRVDGTSKAPKLGVIIAGRTLEAPIRKRERVR
jgi:hypothetical protein